MKISQDVIDRIMEGGPAKEIAKEYGISVSAVYYRKKYLASQGYDVPNTYSSLTEIQKPDWSKPKMVEDDKAPSFRQMDMDKPFGKAYEVLRKAKRISYQDDVGYVVDGKPVNVASVMKLAGVV